MSNQLTKREQAALAILAHMDLAERDESKGAINRAVYLSYLYADALLGYSAPTKAEQPRAEETKTEETKTEETKTEEAMEYPLYWRHDGTDQVGVVHNDEEYAQIFNTKTEIIDIISFELFNELRAQAEQTEEPKAYTLDDVRARVTEVMKADKSKKAALQALLKSHGADRVSELDESKFAAVIDAIEKGAF